MTSCAHDSSDELGRSIPAETFGVLTISYAEHRVPGGAEPMVVVGGVFARHAGVDRRGVLDVLNLPDLPSDDALALTRDNCILVDRVLGEPPGGDPYDTFIELVDAGEIRLGYQDESAPLRLRSFPELYENVTGVTYEGFVPASTVAGRTLQLSGRGSSEVGPFRVALEAPPVPTLIEVAGQPIIGSYSGYDWEGDLNVKWLPAETDPTASGPVMIELVVLQFDRAESLQCMTADTGEVGLPPQGVAALARSVGQDATVRLIVRRLASAQFSTSGLHSGRAYFVARDSVILQTHPR